LDAYPTTTEPVDDTSYAWLEPPPNVPGHVTVAPVVVVVPPLPEAVTTEVKVQTHMPRTISNAGNGTIFLVT